MSRGNQIALTVGIIVKGSPDIQLEWLEFTSNCAALRTAPTTTVLFARKDIDAILAEAAYAFGTSITGAKKGQPSTCSTVNMHMLAVGR